MDNPQLELQTSTLVIDRTSQQKTSKDIELNNIINHLDIIDIYTVRCHCAYKLTNNSRVHVLFKCTWNIHQNRSCYVSQNKH